MHDPSYFREQAHRARRLASEVPNAQDAARLNQVARDLDEMVEDLETGAIELPPSGAAPPKHQLKSSRRPVTQSDAICPAESPQIQLRKSFTGRTPGQVNRHNILPNS